MSRRPNTGNFAVWDIDAGTIVLWVVEGYELRGVWAGKANAGTLRAPTPAPGYDTHRREANFIMREWFWRDEMGHLDYVFVETPHIHPTSVTYSQPFSEDELERYYRFSSAAGVQALSLRYNTARHALKIAGVRKEQNDKRKWFESTTDAACVARYLAGLADFDNFGVLRDRRLDEAKDAWERTQLIEDQRRPVQEQINLWRFNREPLPAWMRLRRDVPEQVTRAMAAILVVYPDATWQWAKRTFELHGRSISGRGRASLIRSEVCHQQGGQAFVADFGWGAVRHEFDRVAACLRSQDYAPQALIRRVRTDAAPVAVLDHQLTFSVVGELEPFDGMPIPTTETTTGQAAAPDNQKWHSLTAPDPSHSEAAR